MGLPGVRSLLISALYLHFITSRGPTLLWLWTLWGKRQNHQKKAGDSGDVAANFLWEQGGYLNREWSDEWNMKTEASHIW